MGILPMPRHQTKHSVKYLASPRNDSTTILGRAGQNQNDHSSCCDKGHNGSKIVLPIFCRQKQRGVRGRTSSFGPTSAHKLNQGERI